MHKMDGMGGSTGGWVNRSMVVKLVPGSESDGVRLCRYPRRAKG